MTLLPQRTEGKETKPRRTTDTVTPRTERNDYNRRVGAFAKRNIHFVVQVSTAY